MKLKINTKAKVNWLQQGVAIFHRESLDTHFVAMPFAQVFHDITDQFIDDQKLKEQLNIVNQTSEYVNEDDWYDFIVQALDNQIFIADKPIN